MRPEMESFLYCLAQVQVSMNVSYILSKSGFVFFKYWLTRMC